MSSATAWIVLGATSVLCFGVKLLGYYVPEGWLARPRLQRVNALVPISLLSALARAITRELFGNLRALKGFPNIHETSLRCASSK